MKKNRKKNTHGFTLMELLVYIGISTIIVVVMMNFITDVTLNATKVKMAKEVQQNARLILERVTQEIKTARQVTPPSSPYTRIDLTNQSGQPVAYYLSGGDFIYEYNNGTQTVSLISNKVKVDQLSFTQNNKIINISLSLKQKNDNAPAAGKSEITLTSAVAPRVLLY